MRRGPLPIRLFLSKDARLVHSLDGSETDPLNLAARSQVYDLKGGKFSVPPEFADNNAKAVKTRDRSPQ